MGMPSQRIPTRGNIQNPQYVKNLEDNLAEKITVNGDITYVAVAVPGSVQTRAVWKAKKIDATDPNNTIITWADGNAEFDNLATDLTSLTYS